ncbi:MAG: xanthine dehydrogenase family protein molybdopterin-binding subunit [Aestuariivita sp.]|nr:xanthine dehydrogenase family protein molybdopterin-binding subunit [Aestuariivita sp.]MCY4203347.1 xanthine dehydrogenase family protein molybdopterin-binding subunit [Aestuariivita sp.]MCY4287637.1 xanthine dehydrogenase family protein molybdopterin-binding subunit [Aestuariivita sp.]MCY4346415.1 xanthine dehydrogenase family protein molybdopterin-binding subunit [Aestuariivita sp.]
MTDAIAYARPKYIGKSIQRLEDSRLLTGRGRYAADFQVPRMAHLAFVRSDQAYARICQIETHDAKELPGVIGIFTASDFAHIPEITAPSKMLNYHPTFCPVLARDFVRYVGEPVVAILAEDRYVGEDAAALIEIEYDPRDVAVTAREASSPNAPKLHDSLGSNTIFSRQFAAGDCVKAISDAVHVVSGQFCMTRKTSVSIEPRAYMAEFEPQKDTLTLHSATNIPGIVRDEIGRLLGLSGNKFRVVTCDVGGSFGGKGSLYPEEIIVCDLALRLERSIKYVADRMEDILSSSQAFEEEVAATLAVDENGHFTALKADILGDIGAYSIYPWTAALEPVQVASFLPGPYRIPHYTATVRGICTPKPPTGPYRGVGRPMAVFALERLVDKAAFTLGLSPTELRRRNLVGTEEFPHRIGSGIIWNRSGFHECLNAAEEAVDLPSIQAEKTSRKDKWVGVGFASYAELTGIGSRIAVAPGMPMNTGAETATIRIDATGAVSAVFAMSSHGQSLETTLAQIVAEELGVLPEDVNVIQGDTSLTPHGTGTYASRSAVIGGGVAVKATRGLLVKVKRVAATLFGVSPSDIQTGDGNIFVPNTNFAINFAEIARLVYSDMSTLPQEARETLEFQATYDPIVGTTTSATHAAVVEIDPETLLIKLRRHFVAEDCGRLINPLVVNGQVHGGVAQGIGAALLEELKFDDAGQPITATLADYLVPTSAEVPDLEVAHIETELPDSPGGFRGMGEGGTIGAPAAIANAVTDALSQLGIEVNSLPITPSKLHALIAAATKQDRQE